MTTWQDKLNEKYSNPVVSKTKTTSNWQDKLNEKYKGTAPTPITPLSIEQQRANGLAKFGITELEETPLKMTIPKLMGGAGFGAEWKNPAFGLPTTAEKALARDIPQEAKNLLRGGSFADTNMEIDHIVPVSLGGTRADYNLQALSSDDKRQEGKMAVELDNINKFTRGELTQGQAIYNILQYSWANDEKKKAIEEQSKASSIFKTVISQINKDAGKAFNFLEKTVGQVPDKILDVVSGTVGAGAAIIAQLPIEIYSQASGNNRKLGQKMEDFINLAKDTSQQAKSTIVGGIQMTPYIATELVKTVGAIGQGVGGNENAMINRMADVYVRHQEVGSQLGYKPATREEIKKLLLSNSKEGNIAALVALGGMALDLIPLKEAATYGIEKGLSKLPQSKNVAIQGQNISADQLADYITGRKPQGQSLTSIQKSALENTNITNLKSVYAKAKAGNLGVTKQVPTFANIATKPMSQLFKQSIEKFNLNIPQPNIKSTGTPLIEGQLGVDHIKSFKNNASKQILDTTAREVGPENAKLFARYINEADLSSAKNSAQLESLALKAVGKNAPSSVVSSIKNWAKSIEQIRFYGGVDTNKGVATPSSDITIKSKVPSVEVKTPSKVAPVAPIKPKVPLEPKPTPKTPEKLKIEPTEAVKPEIKTVKLDTIKTNLLPQVEKVAKTDTPKIKALEESIKSGDSLPTIPVYKEGNNYILNQDGFHRFTAYKNLGIIDVPVRIEAKTKLSASAKQKAELSKSKAQIKPVETIKVPSEQLPVSSKTGKGRASRLAQRMQENLGKLTEEQQDLLPEFNSINRESQLKKASKFVEKDTQKAMAVLRGEEPIPNGILYNSIARAMFEKAKLSNDAGLALQLASLKATRFGQELQMLVGIDETNPALALTRINKAKIEAFRKKGNRSPSRYKKVVKKQIKENIKKAEPKISEWNEFINSIEC